MSISASFLWRFLDDVWDILPADDRRLFETYWSGKLQAASDLEQRAIETSLSTSVLEVPVNITERWNRFVMDDAACDLFTTSDALTLVTTTAAELSWETAFYHTLNVSTSSGQILATQTVQFYDDTARQLSNGDIIEDTVSVRIGSFEYSPKIDYVVNHELGTIQPLSSGRIPFDKPTAITYRHRWYRLDTDYVIDEVNNTVARTADSAIPDGGDVVVSYSYNATPTLQMESSTGVLGIATLTDENQDFGTLLPNRTLTIAEGPNSGTYTINGALAANEIQIQGTFPIPQEEVSYSIDAFPHGQRVNRAIESIPLLQDLIDDPTHVLIEGVDYRVNDGILATNAVFRLSELGPTDQRDPVMWAEVTKIDAELPYRNFGVLLDFYRSNSEAYRLAMQGLWYAFWTGSTPGNIRRGLHILLGLPYARNAGTVTQLDTDAAVLEITDSKGGILVYTIPTGLTPVVAQGDAVDRFASLTNGVEVIDRNNTPGFVAALFGRPGINRFLTSRASRGSGLTDETRALDLLENHLFFPRVLIETLQAGVNAEELTTFLDNIKPAWTEYILAFASEGSDEFGFNDEASDDDISVTIDLSTTVRYNEWNRQILNDNYVIASDTGAILGAGSQATGNFEDTAQNFGAGGDDIRPGDILRLLDGVFAGALTVLERIDDTTLSVDIPDADLVSLSSLSYQILVAVRGLGHDAVELKREHIALPGTEYLTPSGLNTKLDVDFHDLTNEDVVTLLLVDPAHDDNEVQPITAADVDTGGVSVATPPSEAVRDYEVASAALTRIVAGDVTDAYAI